MGITAVWVLIFVVCFFSFIGCLSFYIYKCCKKEKILMNSKQLADALEKQKADAESRLRLKERGSNEESDSEDSDSEDLEEKNSSRKYEFKIIIYVKITLLGLLIGSLYLVDRKFIAFFDSYILISCKFTYINQVMLQGDERNLNINFLGMDVLKNKTKTLLEYYANTTTAEFSSDL
jgi:hypothetical protein